MKLSRGYRNNNPLNIRNSNIKWRGLRKHQSDRSFCQFNDMSFGYRAGIKILMTYYNKYGLKTLKDMLMRYAPPVENDTRSYIDTVSRRAKIDKDVSIDLSDKLTVVRLVEAMSYVENGRPASLCEIEKGFELL